MTPHPTARAPVLVFGVGNPSRGDDALGPLFIDELARMCSSWLGNTGVELLTDFQLQIEHTLDLEGRSRVVFVDASVSAPAPFSFAPVAATEAPRLASHALAPSGLLATYRQVLGPPPEAWLLAIRGERFELGEGLSPEAAANLSAALSFFLDAWSLDPASTPLVTDSQAPAAR